MRDTLQVLSPVIIHNERHFLSLLILQAKSPVITQVWLHLLLILQIIPLFVTVVILFIFQAKSMYITYKSFHKSFNHLIT